jgi:hypothetical protein
MTDEEEYCCGEPRPEDGFMYYRNVTVCETCFTKFPYYDCYCELQHECRQPEVSA